MGNPNLITYLGIFLMIALAGGFAGAVLLLSHLLGPRRDDEVKLSTYESGVDPVGDARVRVSIRYYVVAMLFLIFDVEVAFMYPWAVVYKELLSTGMFILVEMVVFVAILAAGYVYAWKRGALEWA